MIHIFSKYYNLNLLVFCSLIVSFFTSCIKENDSNNYDNFTYHVILVIGQSNTHQGYGVDSILDAPSEKIKQLGRFSSNNYQIIKAEDPLDHLSKVNGSIGFPMTFAKKYSEEYLEGNDKILIIPASKGSTSFAGNFWNPGDTLYNDEINRTNYILKNFKSKLVAILWHQGEDDINNPYYQKSLDSMIVNIRKDIINNNNNIPFILGGMVPYWVDLDSNRMINNDIIKNTPLRILNTGYADPRIPFVIQKIDNTDISIHYDAKGQREMGKRYFNEYKKLNH